MSFKVLIKKVEDYDNVKGFIEEALKSFKVEFKNEVIVKPNFLKYDDPLKASITHPEVVKAVVNSLKSLGLKPIIAEGGLGKNSSKKCFSAFKLYEVAECINLNEEEFMSIKVFGKMLKEVKIAKTAFKAIQNPYISLPKLKVHHLTKVTLGIKNNMGFLKKPAIYMHLNIHQKLVDLLKVFNPSLVIIDGILGGNMSESNTKPVKHGIMIASNNVIAADAIAAKLMGFDPMKIKHIMIAAKEFNVDLKRIEVNEDIEKLKQEYSLSFISKAMGFIGV